MYFRKIAKPDVMALHLIKHFVDRIGEVERVHIEVFSKLWNLQPCDKTNSEVSKNTSMLTVYQKMRKETEH